MAKPRRKPKRRGFRHRRLKVEGVPTGIERLWLVWSFSKKRLLEECPLHWHFHYVEHRPATQAPILAVGAALHYMAKLFFLYRYQTVESFTNTWAHFWMGVCNGDWGPGSRSEKPVTIDWKFDTEKWVWLATGKKILKGFYARHAAHRGTRIGRANEIEFMIPWRNFFLQGKIDRVDEYDVHVEIVDYKMGVYPPYMLEIHGSSQASFYQLGYEYDLFRSFDHKPLTDIRLENLFSGQYQTFDIRGAVEEDNFYQSLRENAWYLQCVYGQPHPLEKPDIQTNRFPTDREGRYVLWPKLPRDTGHCHSCRYQTACVQFEQKCRQSQTAPNGRQLWINAKHLRLAPSLARQPSLFDL